MFSGAFVSGTDSVDRAYCTLCKVQFSVCHGGANDARKHFGTVSSSQTTRSLSDFGFGSSIAARAAGVRAEEMNLKVSKLSHYLCFLSLSTSAFLNW